MYQNVNRGDIFYYDFGQYPKKHLIYKNRPAVVISNNTGNKESDICTIAPITTKTKDSCLPCQVFFKKDDTPQVIQIEQALTVSQNDLGKYCGHMPEFIMNKVDEAIAIQFNLVIHQMEIDRKTWFSNINKSLNNIFETKLIEYSDSIKKQSDNLVKQYNKQRSDVDNLINIVKNLSNEIKYIKDKIQELINSHNGNIDENNKILLELTNLYQSLELKTIETKEILDENNNDNGENDKNINNDFSNENEQIKSENDINKLQYNENYQIKLEKRENRSSWQPKIEYTREATLAYVRDYNKYTTEEMCELYGITKKQLSNRTYLIIQWMKKNGIEFEIQRKKGGPKKNVN